MSHLWVQSGIQSDGHSWIESEDDSQIDLRIDSWDDLPNANACGGSVSVRGSAPRAAPSHESSAAYGSGDCCAVRADDDADVSPDGMGVPRRQFSNGARSLDSSAAHSDGRSLGVSFDRRRDRGYWSSDDGYVDHIVGRRP